MTEQQRNKNLFDALLTVAVAEAFEAEMGALPPEEDLAGFEPSPALEQRIRRLIRENFRKAAAKRAALTIGKIAACLCILLSVSCVVLLSVEATRIAIFNAIIEWNEKYTSFQFANTGSAETVGGFKRPSYLPEGYTEKEAEFHEICAFLVYENSAGDMIIINEQLAEASTTAIDNERHEYSEITVNGVRAHLFKAMAEDDVYIILLEDRGIVYTVLADIDVGELIRIAGSLVGGR